MANKPKLNNTGGTMDICQTPPHALEPLYPYLDKEWTIWESAAGPEELIVNTFRDKGYDVISTDILYGAEFDRFVYRPQAYDIEITNVPFSIKYLWIKQAFKDRKRFAFIVPYETTFAKEFQTEFKQYNNKPWMIEVLSPERRINYKMPNKGWDSSAQMPTCWLTWGLEVWRTKFPADSLTTYYVPMRNVKYDKDNNEKETTGRKRKTSGRISS